MTHPDEEAIRADERERIAQHLDILAARLNGSGAFVRGAVRRLTEQVRAGALPTVLTAEPGPEVRRVVTPAGDVVTRTEGGWIWWGGRSGSRPVWSWEQVRGTFGPLTLPAGDDDEGGEPR